MNGGTEMDVREKLIEILRKPIFPHELADPTEAVADYLTGCLCHIRRKENDYGNWV